MSTECPDDTKSLNLICGIFQSLLFFVGVPKEEYDTRLAGPSISYNKLYTFLPVFNILIHFRWKSFKMLKKVMENRLSGFKKHIRGI
jgi:hypothetical protein